MTDSLMIVDTTLEDYTAIVDACQVLFPVAIASVELNGWDDVNESDALDGLVHGPVADNAGDWRDQRVGIRVGVNEQTATP